MSSGSSSILCTYALGFRIPWRQLPDLAAQHAGERRRRLGQPALADP
jgi:hypothetical protein